MALIRCACSRLGDLDSSSQDRPNEMLMSQPYTASTFAIALCYDDLCQHRIPGAGFSLVFVSTDKWQDVKRNIALMYPYNGTPTTRRYYDVQKIVRDKLQYRCQQSYIVLMSDGDANTSCRSPTGDNLRHAWSSRFCCEAGSARRDVCRKAGQQTGKTDWLCT